MDVETGNEEEESREVGIPTFEEQNENSKMVDMLFTGVSVLLVSKAEVLVDNIKLNY